MKSNARGQVVDVPVGNGLIGRIINPHGPTAGWQGRTGFNERLPMERPAPLYMERDPVSVPLQTGIKVIDALIPSAAVSVN